MKLQHWMELAETALAGDRPDAKASRDAQFPER